MAKDDAVAGREDVSRFIVHLTRNDRADWAKGGGTARDNFLAILKSQSIWALRPHCVYNRKLDVIDEKIKKKFNVACFTEIPLNQLHLLARDIPGRSVKLEPYGFCFTKEFIVRSGGQPAIYINSYDGQMRLRECVDKLFEEAVSKDSLESPEWRILPFINAMHEKYDFSWEREWRTSTNLKFKLSDLVCVVIPSGGDDHIQEACTKAGIAAVSPGWTYEQIVSKLAKQQRSTKSFWKAFNQAEGQ